MRVTTVTYERLTKHRVPSYENERVAVTVEVKNGECHVEALRLAKRKVDDALGLTPSKTEVDDALEILESAGYDVT